MTAIINSLPPGFRFLPTDEELIHYSKSKISSPLSPHASMIAEIDLYKLNPWELPDRAYFGDSEWFCFSPRDRKYPSGARPNRTAASDYWKATGTDKPILSSHASRCLGVKKALVFYKGRAPKGIKTNWMMYEDRLLYTSHLSGRLEGSVRLSWVLCRVRHKGNITKLKKETGSHSFGVACGYCLGGFPCDEDVVEHKFALNNSEDLDAELQEELTAEGRIISDGDFDCKENCKEGRLKEALESIKRVLSLGASDERAPDWSTK